MFHRLRTKLTVAALCLIVLAGACAPAPAEPYCPQPQSGWGPSAYCPGHYPCIPNAGNYGYFPTIWRPWPTERRPDQTFPQSIGREVLPTPMGEVPEPLPRIKVEELPSEQEGPLGEGVTIEGVPSEPRIQAPLQPPPGGALPGLPLESALPSLDTLPPVEPKEEGTAPALPDTKPEDAVPPPAPGAAGSIDGRGYSTLLLAETSRLPALPESTATAEPVSAESPESIDRTQIGSDRIMESGHAPDSQEFRTQASGTLPLALDGYCPVELMEQQLWTLGDPRWTAEHDGVEYRFSKEANMQRFLEAPGRYVPVHGGKDPVVLKRENKQISGQTDYCAIYKDRLYMFSNRDSLTAFRQNPKEYSDAVIRR